jgi:hypothetical protein
MQAPSMLTTRAHKRKKFDSRSPLQQADILQHVLDYVGPGHWCFVAEVSSLWRDIYKRVPARKAQAIDPYKIKTITCVPQMTTFSSVFASPSRVRRAQARGLHYTTEIHQRTAGMCADVATLKAAHELGMLYTHAVMVGAARSNSLTVAHFLRAEGCPWSSYVYTIAAERKHTEKCAFLQAEHCPCDVIRKTSRIALGTIMPVVPADDFDFSDFSDFSICF